MSYIARQEEYRILAKRNRTFESPLERLVDGCDDGDDAQVAEIAIRNQRIKY